MGGGSSERHLLGRACLLLSGSKFWVWLCRWGPGALCQVAPPRWTSTEQRNGHLGLLTSCDCCVSSRVTIRWHYSDCFFTSPGDGEALESL